MNIKINGIRNYKLRSRMKSGTLYQVNGRSLSIFKVDNNGINAVMCDHPGAFFEAS